MKTAIALAIALIVGLVAGFTTAKVRMNRVPWDGDPGGDNIVRQSDTPRNLTDPLVVVQKTEYNFGVMDVNVKGSHKFVITNKGEGTLKLKVGETSCGCIKAKLDAKMLEQGESTNFALSWEPKGYVGKFRQAADLQTNDPTKRTIKFLILGKVTTAVQTIPSELVFSSVLPGVVSTAEIPIYCYVDKPFEIEGFKLADSATAHNFTVTFEPLPKSMLKVEQEAKSGKLVKVAVDPSAEPGLRPGAFKQKILIATNLGAGGSLEIPIRGRLSSDITVVGPIGWNSEKNILLWSAIDAETGGECKLSIFVRGPHRKDVKFKIVRVFPELLKVELGEKRELGESGFVQAPLTIQIPKGSRPANHLGSGESKIGEILLDTNHPESPQLRIRISFLIKG